jgi:hypothetical protein
MFITKSMTRYQRTFEQQMKKKQIKVRNMLMKRIKRVIDVNFTTFNISMQIIHDLYCTNVEDLSSKKLIDEKSTLSMRDEN